MTSICYHASHEQFSPSQLMKFVVQAEKMGFQGIHSSDHFHPWSVRQGQSGFSFSWIAAALQATSLPFSMVCAPGQRYHPGIVAQAIATLAELFPGRINIELGSGEALNETITGDAWPDKDIRNKRLLECANIIRSLLKGNKVSFEGEVKIKDAQLFTLPSHMPLLLGAALSDTTAKWMGTWADGLLTTAGTIEDVMKKINAFRQNGGEGKPVYLQFSFSYARSKIHAIRGAHDQWRTNILPPEKLANFSRVAQFDEAAKDMSEEYVAKNIPIISDIEQLYEEITRLRKINPDRIILHNVNRFQEEFITDFRLLKTKLLSSASMQGPEKIQGFP
jgi:probable non-F420 flavinoid oxidoreductase